MANAEGVASRRINPFGVYKGKDVLQIDENESTHYSVKTDSQIQVPIGNVKEFLRKLEADG